MKQLDLVITWVDGNDEQWLASYKQALSEHGLEFSQKILRERYLPYSDLPTLLRSVEKFAKQLFRKIWIVHDPLQMPAVNTDLVNSVSHDRIIPAEFLPTFNSNVIESYLHRIEGLAEHFVYMNDDCYLTQTMMYQQFVIGDKPLIYLNGETVPTPAEEKFKNPHFRTLSKTSNLLTQKLYHDAPDYTPLRLIAAHLPRVFSKQLYLQGWDLFEDELLRLSRHRLRRSAAAADEAIAFANHLLPHLGLEKGLAIATKPPRGLRCSSDSEHCPIRQAGIEQFPTPSRYELIL